MRRTWREWTRGWGRVGRSEGGGTPGSGDAPVTLGASATGASAGGGRAPGPGALLRHLVLVGLPGAGKSTVGERVARRLARRFVDLDAEVERRAGMRIAEIFARHGERAFRDYELALTRELALEPPLVLSPGGGWVLQPETLALLRGVASIIYLRVSPEVALRRMAEGVSARPLLVGLDPLSTLRALLREREPHYLAADHVVNTDHIDVQEVTIMVAELARGGGGG